MPPNAAPLSAGSGFAVRLGVLAVAIVNMPPLAAADGGFSAGDLNLPIIALALALVAAACALTATLRTRRRNTDRIRSLLERADCLLWEARVVRTGEHFSWSVVPQPSGLFTRLFKNTTRRPNSLWPNLNVPERPEMDARSRHALLTDATGYSQDFRVLQSDGVLWLREHVTITRTGANQWNIVGVVIDVTAEHSAEAAAQTAATRFRALFEHAPVAIVEADFGPLGHWIDETRSAGIGDPGLYLDTNPLAVAEAVARVRLVDANAAALQMFRATDCAVLQQRLRDVLPAGTFRGLARAIEHASSENQAINAEVDLCDLEGRLHHTVLHCWLGRDHAGRPAGHAVIAIVDLTDLKRATGSLSAEKDRLAVTLRAMADAVITTDTAGRVQFLNPAAVALCGWEAGDAANRSINDVCPLHDVAGEAPTAWPVSHVVQADTTVNLASTTQLKSATGEPRRIEGCGAPIHTAGGIVVGAVFVLRDVTARLRYEQDMARAAKLESLGVLAGGIAHDFNNILTVVVGNLNLARLNTGNASELQRALDETERAALQARDLTRQLLTFAKGGDPVCAAVHLHDVLRQIAEFAVRGSRVKCEFDLAPDLWPAVADKSQFSQVVQDLVLNAVQSMPGGGRIRIAARNVSATDNALPEMPPGDHLHITIADTGNGIAAEQLPRVFDPYFSSRRHIADLSLAAAYSIVKKHGGFLDVQSAPGSCTTFHIWLPAMRKPSTPTVSPPASSNSIPRLHGRVLFMDDEEPIRRMAGTLLRRLGLEMEIAEHGASAVEKFRAAHDAGAPFDLVIMDLTVPGGMGGREALEQIRLIDPAVRAIVSSGYSSDEVLADHVAHGFCGCVAKPYKLTELIAVLREALEHTPAEATHP